MPFHLLPRETSLNDLLEGLSGRLPRSAARLRGGGVEDDGSAADRVAGVVEALDRSFITPFDREDIYRLAAAMADVEEAILVASSRPGDGHDAAIGAVVACCEGLDAAVRALRDMNKNGKELRDQLADIERRTAEATRALRAGGDGLGRALDACRAAGRAATVIVVKGA